jgi:DNA-binding MarR family transcriptional regulator
MTSKRKIAADDVAHRIIDHCVAGRVRQISRVVTARYDDELREVGITANQLTILAVVTVLEKTTPSAMRPYLLMDESTLSRNLRRMIENHWLAVLPGEDRRSHYLIVAPEGRRTLERAHPAWERAHAWAVATFGAAGESAVRAIAHRVNPLIPT